MFKYKPGDIIIRDKQFYEPNHMMIVYEVRSPREFVVSHLTYGGLQLYTFHREKSTIFPTKEGANQKVIRWKGNPNVIDKVIQIIRYLHNRYYNIEFSRWESILGFLKTCQNDHPERLHDKSFNRIFQDVNLFCSSYVGLVWKWALETFPEIPDRAFPMTPYNCLPDEMYKILDHIPDYWKVFYVKTSKKGRVRELEFGKKSVKKSKNKSKNKSVKKSKKKSKKSKKKSVKK